MPDFILKWAPSVDYTLGQTYGGHHTSLARYGAGAAIRSSVGLPVNGWLLDLIVKVPTYVSADIDDPFGSPELVNPGNSKIRETPLSFMVNNDAGDPTNILATVSIGAGPGSGEFSAVILSPPEILLGEPINDRIFDGDDPSTPADDPNTGFLTISVVLARISTDFGLMVSLSASLLEILFELRSLTPSNPRGILNDVLTIWRPDTCGCVIVANKKWTELRFLRPCKYHESLQMSEKKVQNEHLEINKVGLKERKNRIEFIRKIRQFNKEKPKAPEAS